MKGIFYRDFHNDHVADILKEIYMERLYDAYKKDGAVVLDIGSNIGLFTLFAYPFASKIYAVEPSVLHNETMKTMLEYNKMTDKVTQIQAAISNYSGEATFYHNDNTTMFSLNPALATEGRETETVPVKTLAQLMSENGLTHIDLAKVDVEGEEMKIFADPSFDAVAPMIDCIITEWHAWTNTNPSQLAASFADRGYKVEQLPTQAIVFVAKR